jgi:hypothetical protein
MSHKLHVLTLPAGVDIIYGRIGTGKEALHICGPSGIINLVTSDVYTRGPEIRGRKTLDDGDRITIKYSPGKER